MPCRAFRFRGRPSSAGAVLRLGTRRISHPFLGLSPLGFRSPYCCLPHSQCVVLGPGLRATNFTPTLTSPFCSTLKTCNRSSRCATLQTGVQHNAMQGEEAKNCPDTRKLSLLHCTGQPAARFTQTCTLDRPIALNNRHRRLNTQQRSCLDACPRRHTPIARSQGRQERAPDAGSLRTMLQHSTGRPASSWARCCPRFSHITD